MATDKGTWTAQVFTRSGVTGRKQNYVSLSSDDFEHDVLLEVRGAFEDMAQKLEYAQDLAQRLNVTKPAA